MSTQSSKNWRVILFENSQKGMWSAQCLEVDIAVQAKTFSALLDELHRVIVAHIILSQQFNKEPFVDIGCAPQKFFDMWDERKLKVTSQQLPLHDSSKEIDDFSGTLELQPV